MNESKNGNFIKIRKQDGIVVVIYLCLIIFAWCMTKPTIMGISASQWILATLAFTFPIVNFVRLKTNQKHGQNI